MKKIIFILLLLSTMTNILASDKKKEEAMQLVKSLILKLKDNTLFLYSDEKLFFGETSIPSFTILLQLGYRDKAGKWLKTKPKYSYIGELIRQKRQLIIKKNSDIEIYASGTRLFEKKRGSNSTFTIDHSDTFVYVTLKCTTNANESFLSCTNNNYTIITFKVFAPSTGSKKYIAIDSIIVNGEPLEYLLGFRRKKILVKAAGKMRTTYMPYLQNKDLEALKLHIDRLK